MATDPFIGIADWLTDLITRPEAPTTYDLYDSEGNKITTKERTSSQQPFTGQTVVKDSKTGKTYLSGEEDFDRIIGKIADTATPKIRINDAKDGLVVSGSTSALQYANNAKLKEYLADTFKYADLSSANVADAIEKLNADLRQSNERYLVEGAIGGNYEDYKEYQLLLQTMKGTNPEKTDVKVKGYDKNGNPQKWTVKQWIDYYQKEYNATERAKLYAESYAKWNRDKDFTAWTPYIIMSGAATGNEGSSMQDATYGFTPAERFGWFTESVFYNYLGKMLEGAGRIAGTVLNPFSWNGYFRKNRLNDIAHSLGHAADVSLSEAKWMSEDAYNEKIDSLVGKDVNKLTSDEQAFLAVALGDKLLGLPGGIGLNTKNFITEEGSDKIDRAQLEQATSYQDYINARDNLSTILKYDEEVRKGSEHPFTGIKEDLEVASEYSPFAVGSGAFLGTMLRMWLQSGIISGVTRGTFNPMNLSDEFAETLVSFLERRGAEGAVSALNSGIGKFMLMVAAEIPEDIIQSAIDDALTGHPEYATQLLTPESLEDNAIQNLIMRVAFTPVHAGFRYAKQKQAIQKALQATKLDRVSGKVASWFNSHEALRRAADTDNIIDFGEDGKSATIRNPDGTTTELDNVAILNFSKGDMAERYPKYAEMLRKKGLVADYQIEENISKRIDDAKKAIENGEYNDVTVSIVPKTEADLDAMYAAKELKSQNGEIVTYRGQPYSADGDFVYNAPDLRRRLAESPVDPQSLDYGYGDAYFFTEYRPWAYEFGDSLVEFSFRTKDTLGFEDYYRLRQEANALAADTNAMAEYAKKYGEENAELMQRIADNSFRAAAEFTGKPIIMATEGMRGPEWLYYKGVDEDFDKSAVAKLLYSSSPEYEEATRANIEMAGRIQEALDTSPYNKTIGDIVAEKYAKNAAEIAEVPNSGSYKWESPDVTKTYASVREVFADMPVGKNLTEVRQWVKNASAFFMNEYVTKTAPEFTQVYKTVDEQQQFVRNMDYLFDLQKTEKVALKDTVGKTYENEGITYTVSQEDIDFYENVVEPMMKPLREAGAAGLGKEAFTITGYLPHSDYDPELLTAEDTMQQGVLWREYSGASTTDDDGNFSTGWLNPDLQARYQTFVHNMLWDSLGDNVVVAKYMEEFNADGLDVAANTVENMVGGRRRLAHLVSESDSVKAVMNNLLRNGEMPSNEALEEAAKKLGATDIIHQLYAPIYGSAGGTLFQDKRAINVKLNSKADWMRTIGTGDGTLYDNGGAMLVNGNADAKYLAKQIFDAAENGRELDVKQMFVDYLMQNQRRTAKGADYVATKWMDKIAQRTMNGGISRRALTAELGRCIYGEGANRLFRFIGRMDTSKLTPANRQALDSLLFRHSALSKVKNTSGITARLNKAANTLIGARMKSLFWMNFKNGILQASECIRLFTEFQIGDAAATIKRMATDKDFMSEVDEWVDMLVPERFVKSDSTASVGALDQIMEKSSYDGDTLTVNKFSPAELRKIGKSFDEFASSPVEMGEALKNRVMMAGILQEAERKGLSGNEMFNYVNKRFERIGLAANEMGRLNASDNPLFRIGANLKTFQIRQFRMFLNNIHDMNGGKEMATYIIKNIGWKAGLALIMSKLGYSTAATMGLDPFDLMDDDYTGVDEENYSGLDYVMLSPVAKLFLSGGFTGYINDLYWASRKAYEDSATVTEQTEDKVNDNFIPGFAAPDTSFDNVFNTFGGFIPGYTAGKRVIQMNELMDMGWAVSATGNKMYEAPSNLFDTATGYLFGRSNTPNARAYYQTPDYVQGFLSGGVAGLGQQLGREFGGFRQFDPMDTQNYTDWFNGSAADEQQWNSGYYYFLKKVDKMQKDYQAAAEKAYTDEAQEDLRNSFNRQLAEVEQQLNKFTAAYEAKHPEGIDARKMRNLTNILNLYQPVMTDTDEEREQRELDANSEALYRYTQAGLPAVTSYSRDKDTGEVEEVYSPQLRSALQGEFGLPEEAAAQIRKLYNDKWKDLGKQYRDRVFSTKGTKNKQAIQNEYIDIVRQDLDPIVELYGNNIWSNEDVENIIDDVFNSMIPKYGQSAKSYLKGIYKNYHGQLRYTERSNETISRIRSLLDEGRTAQAKALGRTLLQRVQENRTSVTRDELEWLQGVLND